MPIEGDRLRVTFEYPDGGRYRSRTCAGDAVEIDRQIGLLPTHVQEAARVAIRRLRDLKLQSPAARQ
jgi:hypothetical protein